MKPSASRYGNHRKPRGGPRGGRAVHPRREGCWRRQPRESQRGPGHGDEEDSRESGPDGGAGAVWSGEWAATHQPGPGIASRWKRRAKLGRLSPEGAPGGSWPWSQNPLASVTMVLDPHRISVPHSTAEKTEAQRGQWLN